MSAIRIGNITKRQEEEKQVEWKIRRFLKVDEDETANCYISFKFVFAGVVFYLRLYPRSKQYPGFASLHPCIAYGVTLVEYNVGLKKLDGGVAKLVTGTLSEKTSLCKPCLFKLSEIQEQNSQLLHSGDLIITCNLKRIISDQNLLYKPRIKRLIKMDTLSDNLKDLYLKKENCYAFLYVNGKEYRAPKIVLTARSSTFAAMLPHDASEKHTDIVIIIDCDPEAFEQFLEFLYTGKLENLSFQRVFQLYEISDEFNVLELKAFCMESFMQNLTVENLCYVVITADKHNDFKLLSEVQSFFNRNLRQVFLTSGWNSLLGQNPFLANKLLMSYCLRN